MIEPFFEQSQVHLQIANLNIEDRDSSAKWRSVESHAHVTQQRSPYSNIVRKRPGVEPWPRRTGSHWNSNFLAWPS